MDGDQAGGGIFDWFRSVRSKCKGTGYDDPACRPNAARVPEPQAWLKTADENVWLGPPVPEGPPDPEGPPVPEDPPALDVPDVPAQGPPALQVPDVPSQNPFALAVPDVQAHDLTAPDLRPALDIPARPVPDDRQVGPVTSFGRARKGTPDERVADDLRSKYVPTFSMLVKAMEKVAKDIDRARRRDGKLPFQDLNKICLIIPQVVRDSEVTARLLARDLKDARAVSKSPYAIEALNGLALKKAEFDQHLYRWARLVNQTTEVDSKCRARPQVLPIKLPRTVQKIKMRPNMGFVQEETSGDIRSQAGGDDYFGSGSDTLYEQTVSADPVDEIADEIIREQDVSEVPVEEHASRREVKKAVEDDSDSDDDGGIDYGISGNQAGGDGRVTRVCRAGKHIMDDIASGKLDLDSMEAQVFFASLAVKGRKRWENEVDAPKGSGYLYFDSSDKDPSRAVLKRATHAKKEKTGTNVRGAGPRVFMMTFKGPVKSGLGDAAPQEQIIVYSVRGSTKKSDWITDAIRTNGWKRWLAEKMNIIKQTPALLSSEVTQNASFGKNDVHGGIFSFGVLVGHIILAHLALGHCQAVNRVIITGCSLGGASALIAGHMVYHHVTGFAALKENVAEQGLMQTLSDADTLKTVLAEVKTTPDAHGGDISPAEKPEPKVVVELAESIRGRTQKHYVYQNTDLPITINVLDVRSFAAPGYINKPTLAMSMTGQDIKRLNESLTGPQLRLTNQCNMGDGVIFCDLMLNHRLTYPVEYNKSGIARECGNHGISSLVNTDPCGVLGDTRHLHKYFFSGRPASFLHNIVTEVTPDGMPIFWASSESKAKKVDKTSEKLVEAARDCLRSVRDESVMVETWRSVTTAYDGDVLPSLSAYLTKDDESEQGAPLSSRYFAPHDNAAFEDFALTRRPTDAADYDLASGRFSGRDRQDDDSSSRSSDDEQTLGLRGGQTGGARFTAASASLSAVVLLMSVFGSVVYGA